MGEENGLTVKMFSHKTTTQATIPSPKQKQKKGGERGAESGGRDGGREGERGEKEGGGDIPKLVG